MLCSELQVRGVRLGKERRKIRVEGRDSDDWMAVDLGNYSVPLEISPQ